MYSGINNMYFFCINNMKLAIHAIIYLPIIHIGIVLGKHCDLIRSYLQSTRCETDADCWVSLLLYYNYRHMPRLLSLLIQMPCLQQICLVCTQFIKQYAYTKSYITVFLQVCRFCFNNCKMLNKMSLIAFTYICRQMSYHVFHYFSTILWKLKYIYYGALTDPVHIILTG